METIKICMVCGTKFLSAFNKCPECSFSLSYDPDLFENYDPNPYLTESKATT
jgi:hypothetical protein